MAIPTTAQIERIPLSTSGAFDLNDIETAKTRRLLYAINKDGIRKYRTQREGHLLLVWRIR